MLVTHDGLMQDDLDVSEVAITRELAASYQDIHMKIRTKLQNEWRGIQKKVLKELFI